MKKEVKKYSYLCDLDNCNKEIDDFEEYKNVCFICHKDFCNDHITLFNSFDGSTGAFAICDDCFNKLSDSFEEYICQE